MYLPMLQSVKNRTQVTIKRAMIFAGAYLGLIKTLIMKLSTINPDRYGIGAYLLKNTAAIIVVKTIKNRIPALARTSLSFKTL